MNAGSSRSPRSTPSLQHHKATGQGFVRLDGRTIYLGRHELPETREKYHRFIAEWEAAGRHLPRPAAGLTVVELVERFWGFAQQHYRRPDGSPALEQDNYRLALRPLLDLYASLSVAEFGPRALKAVRQRMVELGWARTHANRQVARVKYLFKWGTEEELVPAAVHHALTAVRGLQRGRCEARETSPVRPVPEHLVAAIRPYVSRQVWAMVQVQLLTACRPDEVTRLRPLDLDVAGDVWTARLDEHKTSHHGIKKLIHIGPRAQDQIRPFLAGRAGGDFLFSPAEAEGERRDELHQERTTPPSAGNRPGTNRKPEPRRRPRARYDVNTYRRAIWRACDRAFPLPGPLARSRVNGNSDGRWETQREWHDRLGLDGRRQRRAWWAEHRWSPNQLRHAAATRLRGEFGIDTAQTILGHQIGSRITEVYSEANRLKAVDALKRVG